MKGSVWAVTMVRDEADIIAHTIRQLLYQGVDGIIVADNLSTDGTRDVLESVKSEGRIIVTEDREVAYYQGRKMTALSAKAADLGAKWVIPFDADELWYSTEDTVADALRKSQAQVVRVDRWDYLCTEADSADPNPYRRIQYRRAAPSPRGKVAYQPATGLHIGMGNHRITGKGGKTVPATPQSAVRIAHFPCRSFGHFVRKIRNGHEAITAAKLREGMVGVWRRNGEILKTQGVEGLRREFETHYFKSASALRYSPAPYLQ